MRRLLYILMTMCLSLMTWVGGSSALRAQESEWSFVQVLPLCDQMPVMNDSLFEVDAQGVIFEVNKTVIDKENPWLHLLRDSVLPWALDNHLRLVGVQISAASSPEGPRGWNETLATRRAQTIDRTMRKLFASIDGVLNQEGEISAHVLQYSLSARPEDYTRLVALMSENGDKDLERVLSVLNLGLPHDQTKQRLMRIDEGKMWRRLVHTYYPDVRCARVMLYFQKECMLEELQGVMALRVEPEHVSAEEQLARLDLKSIKPISGAPIVLPIVPDTSDNQQVDTIVDWADSLHQVRPRRHVLAVRTNMLFDFFYMPKIGQYEKYGFAPTPNIAFEYYPLHGPVTANLRLTFADWERWNTHQFWQIQDITAEARYYVRQRARAPKDAGIYADEIKDVFGGFFIGVYGMLNRQGMGTDGVRGEMGEGIGAGLSMGYVLPICKSYRWRLEFTVAAGYYVTRYDRYVYYNPLTHRVDGLYYYDYDGDPAKYIPRQNRFRYFGPTEIGIQLTYDLLYRKNGQSAKKDGTPVRHKNKAKASVYRWEVVEPDAEPAEEGGSL